MYFLRTKGRHMYIKLPISSVPWSSLDDQQPDKKRELETYRALGMYRENKSRRRRDRVSGGGIYRFIGGTSNDRPYIKVLKRDYMQAWEIVTTEMRKQLEDFSPEELQSLEGSHLTREIENRIYDRLSALSQKMAELESSFVKQHGRRMTPHERNTFAKVIGTEPSTPPSPEARARAARSKLMHDVVAQIGRQQKNSESNLQEAWASVVGSEVAMEVKLDRVDAEQGIAYCRCLSSVRLFELKRQSRGLSKKLAKALKMNISKIVFR